MCHCEDGWKGAECDIPLGDCQVPDCNQHGQCVRGSCVCNPGWKGAFCDERKLKTCLAKRLMAIYVNGGYALVLSKIIHVNEVIRIPKPICLRGNLNLEK